MCYGVRKEMNLMLTFRDITIEDKQLFEKYTNDIPYHLCEYCFVDVFIWRMHYDTKICDMGDGLYISCYDENLGHRLYLCPMMDNKADISKHIKRLMEDAKEREIPFVMISVSEEKRKLIEEQMPGIFAFEENRDNADYLYLKERLSELAGKKLHSKRNFINRFKLNYEGRWEYAPITQESIQDVFAFHMKWCEINGCGSDESFLFETCAISQGLRNFKKLGLSGGILYLDGEIIAYTLGSKSGSDMFIVHIEKADHNIAGSYQMINQQFVQNIINDVKYINREEDLGIEGLRKAKLSYYPDVLITNYIARPMGDVM